MSISKIKKDLEGQKKFPPVDQWNPDLCEGQEFFIDREGDWFYNNSPIKNKKLINLFSTVIRKDDDNYFFKELLRDDYDPKNGFWNGELDFIKNQLPSQEKDLAVAKEFINAWKISDFHRSHNFAVESFSWEAKN